MTVTLCNNNPNSPNAVRLGNGIFGGKILSRDRYNVLEGKAPFPFQYQCWQVRDLQDGKWYVVVKHGNVETRSCTCKDYNENYKKYGDGTWSSFGFAKYACEHIRAVALYLDECRKDARKRRREASPALQKSAPQTIGEHTQHLIDGWGNLVKPHATGKAKKEFWDGVRIYANRRGINPDELTKAVLKKLFPTPQKSEKMSAKPSSFGKAMVNRPVGSPTFSTRGVKSSDFWTDEVKKKMATAESKSRKHKQAPPLRCASCGDRILPGKKRCSRCVDRMLSRKGWDPDQPDLPTTNTPVRNPLEKAKETGRKIKAEREKVEAKPSLFCPVCKVHIHSTNSRQFAISEDDGNGRQGETLEGGFSNRIKAKIFAEREFPGAKIIVWKDL